MPKAFVYDYDRFPKELIDACRSNEVIFREGVAYWKPGLGKVGSILCHIPLKEIPYEAGENIIKHINSISDSLKSTLATAQVLSTGTMIVANLIQTTILSKKIEMVNKNIMQAIEGLNEQNLVNYSKICAEYFSTILAIQTFLSLPYEEAGTIGEKAIFESICLKNNIGLFIISIIQMIETKKINQNDHIEILLNFTQNILEIMPVGMHLEYMLCKHYDKKLLAETCLKESRNIYEKISGSYKNHLNNIDRNIKLFQIKDSDVPYFQKIKPAAKELFEANLSDRLLRIDKKSDD